jgi:adenosylhomocysteine nucleosidase
MIGIIAAMAQETTYLKQQMSDLSSFVIGESIFWTGNINNQPIVLLQCGIGKVNAAIGTTLLIERFKPDHIINTGVAGGLNSDLKIGDIVISIEVRHHDVDLTVWGYEHGQLPKSPAAFMPSLLLIEAANTAAQELGMQVTHGLIISGDSFIHEQAQIAKIQEKFAKAHAVEMEAAAIAQVCHQFNVPFVIIRALSDIAGKDSPVSFDIFLEQAAKNSAELILHTLAQLKS